MILRHGLRGRHRCDLLTCWLDTQSGFDLVTSECATQPVRRAPYGQALCVQRHCHEFRLHAQGQGVCRAFASTAAFEHEPYVARTDSRTLSDGPGHRKRQLAAAALQAASET